MIKPETVKILIPSNTILVANCKCKSCERVTCIAVLIMFHVQYISYCSCFKLYSCKNPFKKYIKNKYIIRNYRNNKW